MLAATLDRFEELEPYLRSFVEAFPPALRSEDLRKTMASAYEEVRVAGAAMLEHVFEGAEPPLAAEHRRTITSLLIALCDGLILQWLLDRDAIPNSQAMLDALAAVAAHHTRGCRRECKRLTHEDTVAYAARFT
jgi:BetI-type transcriptional repressor, C-terminal